MEDYRNLLNIKPLSPTRYKNILQVWVEWDSNDADYIEKSIDIEPKTLFGCKKLIYCLAYATLPHDFKGHGWNDAVFCHHITENKDIDNLEDIIFENDFGCSTDCGRCHTLSDLSIAYYDENGNPFNITFTDIHKRWENMSYEDICKEINEIEYEDPYL